jgi:hypothetical protein
VLTITVHTRLSPSYPAAPAVVFAGGAKLGPKEQAYVAAVKRLNEAVAAKQPVNSIATFGAACEQYEDKQPTTLMSSCWKLLGDILSKAQARGLSPADQPQLYIEALIQVGLVHRVMGVVFVACLPVVLAAHPGWGFCLQRT